MYRLVRFRATNLIGFMSGMGRKTVEIDLTPFADKDIICCIGDNGTGKSTFLSFVHPSPYPTDGRNKFIIEGKEGLLVREYLGDDGTLFTSKCIYTPKKSGGHNSKCYLEMTHPDSKPIELNPDGNVGSYMSLLYTYFGITKNYLTFASYTNEVSNIVKMTDTERKNSVGSLVPNTKRFAIAYDIVNEKYKNLRNLIRNVSQKILLLRDEDSLEADLDRLTDEIRTFTEDREDRIKKLAKTDGRLKELTGDKDIDALIQRYTSLVAGLASYDSEIDRVFSKLMKLYDKLGIEPDKKDSINFSKIDQVPSFILKYERRLAENVGSLQGYVSREEQLRKELHQVEKDIGETESLIYSIQYQDIKELEKSRAEYIKQINSMRYAQDMDRYENMSYDEVVNFSRTVAMLDHMIRALYDEYGDLVSQYFSSDSMEDYRKKSNNEMEELTVTIQTTSAKRDQIYRKILEKEQYQQFQDVLNQRPKTCTIDTCPFISNALKWRGVADEISALKSEYKDLSIKLEGSQKDQYQISQKFAIMSDGQRVIEYIALNQELIAKYLGVTDLVTLYRAIANATWGNILDIMKLKEIAAVLSEKDLYLQITQQRLPEIDHAIELSRAHGTNRDFLINQLERLENTRNILRSELDLYHMHIAIGEDQKKRYKRKLDLWTEVSDGIDTYRRLIAEQLEAQAEVNDQDDKIHKIKELTDKCKEQKHMIKELEGLIRERTPKREQIRLDLDAIRRLKIEKAEIERDFIVVDIIRSIVAPGKGIRKELINIYMYDICQIANQLLLTMFDGKLYLKEFLITDKEFIIPYVYNGSEGSDISFASSAQQSTITSAISLAILSRMVDKYGIYTGDEQDNALNPKNKNEFIGNFANQMRYVGIVQAFIITQEPSYYEPYSPGMLIFPGGEVHSKDLDTILV